MCGLLRSGTLFKMRPAKINIAVKGVSKKHIDLHFQRCKDALHVFLKTRRDSELEGKDIDKAKNVGFNQNIVTYEKKKLGLSAHYDKRYVLADGIHTRQLDFLTKFFNHPS